MNTTELTKRFFNFAKSTPNPITKSQFTNAVIALSDFDFDKQAKLMQFLDWKWVINFPFGGVLVKVPSKDEIIDHVIKSICDAYWKLEVGDEKTAIVDCGGFRITVSENNCVIEFIANRANGSSY